MKRKSLWNAFVASIMLPFLVAACAPAEMPTDVPTRAPSAAPSPTSSPMLALTYALTSTSTPEPTHTVTSTSTNPPPTPVPIPTSTPTPAPTPYAKNVEVVGHIGGWVSAVVAQGHYLYAGIGSELAVLDISIPEQPTRVGYVVLPDLVKDIVVHGDYAYVAAESLYVIDVSDAGNPFPVSFLNTGRDPRSWRSHYIATNITTIQDRTFLYTADVECHGLDDCSGRLRVIDVSEPAAPFEAGGYDTAIRLSDVAVLNGVAYLATPNGLWIVDISDPTAPMQVGLYDTEERVVGVETWGDYVYIVVERTGLHVLDATDPIHLERIGFYEFDESCFPPYLYDFRMSIVDGILYTSGCSYGVRIIDTSESHSPLEVGFAALGPAYCVSSLSSTGGVAVTDLPWSKVSGQVYAYVSNGFGFDGRDGGALGGISVIDVTDPALSVQVGGYDAPGSILSVAVTGDPVFGGETYALAATYREGLRVIDVSEPTNPKQVGALDASRETTDVLITGTYAYVADQYCDHISHCQGSLRIVDFAEPRAPTEVGIYDPPGGFRRIRRVGHHLYVWNDEASIDDTAHTRAPYTLRILDISSPLKPVEIWTHDLWDLPIQEVTQREHYAYLSGDGLLILDISDPMAPRKVRLYDVYGKGLDGADVPPTADLADSEGPYIYTATDRFYVIDVSSPTEPAIVGSHSWDSIPCSWIFAVIEDFVYCNSLSIIDVSDPRIPIEAGFYSTPPGFPKTAELGYESPSGTESPLVYLADYLGGLYILRFTPPVE